MTPRSASAAEWCAAGMRYGTRRAGDPARWARCVDHRGTEVQPFAAAHFGESHRRVLLLCGAGFDPRSLVVARLLASVAPDRVDGFFLRERRPDPHPSLLSRATEHATRLGELVNK